MSTTYRDLAREIYRKSNLPVIDLGLYLTKHGGTIKSAGSYRVGKNLEEMTVRFVRKRDTVIPFMSVFDDTTTETGMFKRDVVERHALNEGCLVIFDVHDFTGAPVFIPVDDIPTVTRGRSLVVRASRPILATLGVWLNSTHVIKAVRSESGKKTALEDAKRIPIPDTVLPDEAVDRYFTMIHQRAKTIREVVEMTQEIEAITNSMSGRDLMRSSAQNEVER